MEMWAFAITWRPLTFHILMFSSKTLVQMKKNLVGSTYGKFCIRFLQNRMKGEQQSVLTPRHVAVFNIGAYWEMNNNFS